MKVLVTGAGGQLGYALCSSAPETVNLVAPDHSQLAIDDSQQLKECLENHHPDIIINAAAFTHVDKAETEIETAFSINADAAGELARQAMAIGARLIHVSTDYVFDGRTSKPYTVDAKPSPINVYGESKLAGEKNIQNTMAGAATIVRSSWLYSHRGSNFLTTLLQKMERGEDLRIVDDQTGSPTSVDHLARVLWALCKDASISGLVHWSNAGQTSWFGFANAIAGRAMAGRLIARMPLVTPISSDEISTAAKRPAYSALECSLSNERPDLEPESWQLALDQMFGRLQP